MQGVFAAKSLYFVPGLLCLFACSDTPRRGGSGESCTSANDCNSGLSCIAQVCTAASDGGPASNGAGAIAGASCGARRDCASGLMCVSNICQQQSVGVSPGSRFSGRG